MNLLVTICARGGSKGIPGKNIKPVAGVPLIAYTINTARKFAEKHHAVIALSTDDEAIKAAAASAGIASGYKRPDDLATDTAGKIDTIRDLLHFSEVQHKCRYDFVLDLDVTSPLRTLNDIEKGYQLIAADPDALTLFSVSKANRNPYFNMVEVNGKYCSLVKKGSDNIPLTRQSAPPVYDLNASFYWYRRSFFDLGAKSVITERSLIYEMDHICFDLDHMIDFEFLDFLLTNKKLDFEL
jgi:CMP-N-acetylneuraminic acid synthetase